MKKVLLSLTVIFCAASAAMAQHSDHDGHAHAAPASKAAKPTTETVAKPSSLTAENMVFTEEVFDFGTIAEGPNAEHVFTFKNTGKEPIILQNVSASCGCTTPQWSKDPVLPGKTGTVKASYSTAGRPNAFNKTVTVVSNAGTKVLTIKGNVEKAPDSSVPQNTSMLKTN
jgi:hypothetical protein